MIEIKKGKIPNALVRYRKTTDATYDNMHGAKLDNSGKDVYSIVLESLMKEQGYLCAYCMCRIPQRKYNPSATIEHIETQSISDEATKLDYNNMLAVCSGNRNGNNEVKTCDAKRGTLPVNKQKMLLNPLDAKTLKTIQYHSDGTIFSDDKEVDDNLNKTLNLNGRETGLVECRKQALISLQGFINKKYQGKTVKNDYFKSLLTKYQDEEGKKTPYVGILINWLQRKAGC